jgi:hypothetical protein
VCKVQQKDLALLPCLHKFHRTCVESWLKHNHCCPECRVDVKESARMQREPPSESRRVELMRVRRPVAASENEVLDLCSSESD